MSVFDSSFPPEKHLSSLAFRGGPAIPLFDTLPLKLINILTTLQAGWYGGSIIFGFFVCLRGVDLGWLD